MTPDEGYAKYRGKCKEYCEQAVSSDPTLTIVRGYYYDPIWGTVEQHWWTKRADDTIYDPTCEQFPSAGGGLYEEFNGWYSCDECGKEVEEKDAVPCGNYVCCSQRCAFHLVGLGEYYRESSK